MRPEEEDFIIERGRVRSIAIRMYAGLATALLLFGGVPLLIQVMR